MKPEQATKDCPELMERAELGLYDTNTFRVLEVPVTASPGEARRAQQRREMEAKLGLHDGTSTGAFPVPGGATPETVRAAMERISTPEARLLDEIFWFCPINGAESDPGLTAIAEGDAQRAESFWRGLANQGESGILATHNLAVLHHMRALEQEAAGESDFLDKLWKAALEHWCEVHASDAYWNTVRDRVREIGDQKLTTGFVRRVRENLPASLLLINAKLLYTAAGAGDEKACRRQTGILKAGVFDAMAREEAYKTALKPLRSRLKQMVADAKSRWKAKPQRGRAIVLELHESTAPLLAIVDYMLPEDDVVRTGLHDLVGEHLLKGEVAFVDKTNDWRAGIPLLEMARKIAVGEDLLERLDRQITVRGENADLANDWCATGYWDMPQETIDLLESIRKLADTSDFDTAIERLAALDPALGAPLRRCLAYSLSLKAIRIGNNAMGDYNEHPAVVQKIISLIKNSNSHLAALMLRRPDPQAESFMNPSCPCCGASHYTQWTNFELLDIPVWMCSSCASTWDRQVENQKRELRKGITEGLQYILLAAEIDPDDAGIKRNLKKIRENAKEFSAKVPSVDALKKSLASNPMRGTPAPYESPAGELCFFCDDRSADEASAVSVPMCGELVTAPTFFGQGIEYRQTTVTVPRCAHCCQAHESLPDEIEAWEAGKLEVSSSGNFPELVAALKQADEDRDSTERQVWSLTKEQKKAEDELDEAEALGSQCEQCGSADDWSGNLCRQCDGRVFSLGGGTVARMVLLGAVVPIMFITGLASGDVADQITSFLARVSPAASEAFNMQWVYVGIFIAMLIPTLMVFLRGRRNLVEARVVLAESRETEFMSRRKEAVAAANQALTIAKNMISASQEVADDRNRKAEGAKQLLEDVMATAAENYANDNPSPLMKMGVRHEDDYLEHGSLASYRQRGWGYGNRPTNSDGGFAEEPVGVVGLVGRTPMAVEEIIEEKRVATGKATRDEVVRMARESDRKALAVCPVCGTKVKAKNLVKHFDKQHPQG